MDDTPDPYTPDRMAPIAAAAKRVKQARTNVATVETQLRADVADAHPDDLPDGQRLTGTDRGFQKELARVTGWTAAHLRKIKADVRSARVAKGQDPRGADREAAAARLPDELDRQGRVRALGRVSKLANARRDLTAAQDALGDLVLELLPYTPGERTPGRVAAYKALRAAGVVGSDRTLDTMREDAATRRSARTTVPKGVAHVEADGYETPSILDDQDDD
ncbi:hypothetical protein AB0G95_21860 [Streptomyces virginiae]|uniref:hypothetical protein n=1 Tax=Streptomyces virginiae TaxID=1961 RepID=UPI00343AF168